MMGGLIFLAASLSQSIDWKKGCLRTPEPNGLINWPRPLKTKKNEERKTTNSKERRTERLLGVPLPFNRFRGSFSRSWRRGKPSITDWLHQGELIVARTWFMMDLALAGM
jgi:hypothetical protein